jgi:hypothetical protein
MEQLRTRSAIGRFIFLDQARYDLNDTLTVLGCTSFSRVTPKQTAEAASRFVDLREVQNWTVEDHVDAHTSDLHWLNAQVSAISKAQPPRQLTIFTHYSPTQDLRTVDDQHRGSPVVSGFSTDLSSEECWTSSSVVMWAFRHTHFSSDFIDGLGKRVVANQRGYSMALGMGSISSSFDSGRTFLVGR